MESHEDATPGREDRPADLDAVLDLYLERLYSAAPLTREQLEEQHPELMPRLGEALHRLEFIQRSREDETLPYRPGSITDDDAGGGGSPAFSGQRLGRFSLIECVGMGGFGAVWKAHDPQLDRVVALKVPRQPLDERHLDDFVNEARITAKLKHPHIVRVHEVGEFEGTMFIVTDFIDGVPLDVWATEHEPDFQEMAVMCHKLAVAVDLAHRTGIVHRDLKPGNILLNKRGEPAITDFGLAKQHAPDVTMTMEGRIVGTPAYMSPEQAAGHSSRADARSDVYSLGVILFELLTGERPFRGNAPLLIQHVLFADPPYPRRLNPQVPRDLETICLKCLQKDPERRYESAAELAQELQRYLNGEPILARPISRAERMVRWCGRNPVMAGFATASIVLLLSLIAAGWWSYFDERRDRRELQAALEQEDLIRQAFLQTEDFRVFREGVEELAESQELFALCARLSRNDEIRDLCRELREREAELASPEWQALQERFTRHPVRRELQDWLEIRAESSSVRPFAWFILDAHGAQAARQPPDLAFGRNYAWRTYFHGGARDYEDYEDYAASAPMNERRLYQTYLSRALFTNVTNRYVVVVATPIEQGGEFVGVLGLMLELEVAEAE